MRNLIGFDFSIKKPAACIFSDNEYSFMSWPHGLSENVLKVYKKANMNIIARKDTKEKDDNVSDKMRNEIKNAAYVADLIVDTLMPVLNQETFISFEGISYGSSGNVALQLSSYKYVLMVALSRIVPIENMFTYSPITVKATAGCSKKGMTKSDVIDSFIRSSKEVVFTTYLKNNIEIFKKKKSVNWIDHVDDIVDSYFVLETLRIKENL